MSNYYKQLLSQLDRLSKKRAKRKRKKRTKHVVKHKLYLAIVPIRIKPKKK